LSPDNSSTVPTVTDNLFSDGTIPENVLGVSFEPITDPSGQQTNGELTWGMCIHHSNSQPKNLNFPQVALTLQDSLATSPTCKHIRNLFLNSHELSNFKYVGPSPAPFLQANSGVLMRPSPMARPPFYQILPVLLTPVRSNGND
jgi:hypothetical protein